MPTIQTPKYAFTGFRLTLCSLWLALTAALLTLVVVQELANSERRFAAQADLLGQAITIHVEQKQTRLQQWGNRLAVTENQGRQRTRELMSQLLRQQPDILQLVLAQKVPEAAVARWARAQDSNFFPAGFNGNRGERRSLTPNRGAYYLVTAEPKGTPPGQSLQGLDLASWPPLAQALQSLSTRASTEVVLTPRIVFPGIGPAVALLMPIMRPGETLYAVMLLAPDSLLPKMPDQSTSLTLHKMDSAADNPAGQLLRVPALANMMPLTHTLLPHLQNRRNLVSGLSLQMQQQLGWRDLFWPWLGVLTLGALLLLGLLWQLAERLHQSEQLRPRAGQRLFYQANYDPLTGLPNRNLLLAFLRQACAGARRRRTKLGVLSLDPIRFRRINEDYGRDLGDRVLRCMANKLRHSIREDDIAARVAGDMFVIVLQNMNSRADVAMVAEKLYEVLGQTFWVQDVKMELGISMGIAVYPDDATTPEKLLELADHNLLVVKKGREKPVSLKSRQGSQFP